MDVRGDGFGRYYVDNVIRGGIQPGKSIVNQLLTRIADYLE